MQIMEMGSSLIEENLTLVRLRRCFGFQIIFIINGTVIYPIPSFNSHIPIQSSTLQVGIYFVPRV
jgi:hypothetical protein